MYCAFCGNRSVGVCHSCGRRVCRHHRHWWPTGAACRDCLGRKATRVALFAGVTVVVGLVLLVVVAVLAK